VLRATGRFPMDKAGYRQLLGYVRQWPRRTWAVEGAQGVGRPLTARLLAGGETVVDVPAKLAARVRVFDTGQGRKTDATDAHAVVMVALRTGGLRHLVVDDDLAVLRLLADRVRARYSVPRCDLRVFVEEPPRRLRRQTRMGRLRCGSGSGRSGAAWPIERCGRCSL
jgi:Transposase